MSTQKEVASSTQVSFISQAERKNARFQRSMEDAHIVIPCLNGDRDMFYASVFDGHGGIFCVCSFNFLGRETADYVCENLHLNLVNAIDSKELDSIEKCLEYAYYYTDIESKNKDLKNSGSTGVTILILNEDNKRVLYSANAGDSRSVLFSDGKTTRLSYVCFFFYFYSRTIRLLIQKKNNGLLVLVAIL